mmetsp:Transcript_12905/g.22316  ORF Transcript_12905/g.22316 Transcript_12905/m.22316 type:complete len:322 (-) Transcript_12905:678-1643(-)
MSPRIPRKKLELLEQLHEIRGFAEPKKELEQYPTSAEVASDILWAAFFIENDWADISIADLGCGPGILGIGSLVMGCRHVVGVDIDAEALEVAEQNADTTGVPLDLLCMDILSGHASQCAALRMDSVDVVVMNPPFGTKGNSGIDMLFLNRALQVCRRAVYSFHKSSTRQHVIKVATGWGADAELVQELQFDVGRLYKNHRHDAVLVNVDCLRFAKRRPIQTPRRSLAPLPAHPSTLPVSAPSTSTTGASVSSSSRAVSALVGWPPAPPDRNGAEPRQRARWQSKLRAVGPPRRSRPLGLDEAAARGAAVDEGDAQDATGD